MFSSNGSKMLCSYVPALYRVKIFCLTATLAGLTGCQTPATGSLPLGIQPQYEAFVPARTAVFPCLAWPHNARPKDLPLTNVDTATIEQLCGEVDKAVLDAFTNQPFMKGYSPTYVANRIAPLDLSYDLSTLSKLWSLTGENCASCDSLESTYTQHIALHPEWRNWLSQVSSHLNYADAVLMPFVTYAYHRRFEQRGTMVQDRNLEVVVLLLATKNADLIWLGKRQATIPVYAFQSSDLPEDVPPWEDVLDLILTENLWMEYPGRQVY